MTRQRNKENYDVRPDLIHVQHFSNWPLGALQVLVASRIRFLISFHDLFAITPDAGMTHAEDPLKCFTAEYAVAAFGHDVSESLHARRKLLTRLLPAAAARVVVSPYTKRMMERVYPLTYREIEYGVDEFVPSQRLASDSLRFGFVGNLRVHKGWRVLADAFGQVRSRHPAVECRFYGAGDEPVPAPGVTYCGGYTRADLPRICSEIDVAVIPSIFRETYCMVLSEMWMGGLPVAVSDLGALADRVVDGVSGRKFSPGDSAALAGVLDWFIERPDIWRNWRPARPRTTTEMIADYERLYHELLT